MNLSRTSLLLAVPLLLAAAAPFALAPVQDYTSLPPDAAEVFAQLGGKKSLAAAIEAAQQAAGGLAREATFGADGNVTVHVYSASEHSVVVLDGATGAVKSKEARARFPGAPVTGPWIELPSGLKYYDLVVGKGEKPPGPTAKVKVHYSGWLTDGTKFDSSVDRGQPLDFALNGVIKGWTEGVGSMQIGGKRKLIVPYSLAYGATGRPPVIPPKATLVFDVELLAIVP